jgi:CCR4-NOT transcription complex subunit 7/8
MFAADSIDLLKNSGIDFAKFEELGIDVQVFGELMMMSGLVLNPDVKWVSFHSSYDFGYLVKTLTCCDLPLNEPAFMESLHTYFPCIYDVKVIKECCTHIINETMDSKCYIHSFTHSIHYLLFSL